MLTRTLVWQEPRIQFERRHSSGKGACLLEFWQWCPILKFSKEGWGKLQVCLLLPVQLLWDPRSCIQLGSHVGEMAKDLITLRFWLLAWDCRITWQAAGYG